MRVTMRLHAVERIGFSKNGTGVERPTGTPQPRGPRRDRETEGWSGSRDVVMVGECGCRADGDEERGIEARQDGADALQFHVASPVGGMNGSFERLHDVLRSRDEIVRSRRLIVSTGHDDKRCMRGANRARGDLVRTEVQLVGGSSGEGPTSSPLQRSGSGVRDPDEGDGTGDRGHPRQQQMREGEASQLFPDLTRWTCTECGRANLRCSRGERRQGGVGFAPERVQVRASHDECVESCESELSAGLEAGHVVTR